jgi:hypothetical protein
LRVNPQREILEKALVLPQNNGVGERWMARPIGIEGALGIQP